MDSLKDLERMNKVLLPNPPPVEDVAALKALLIRKDQQIMRLYSTHDALVDFLSDKHPDVLSEWFDISDDIGAR